MIRNSRDTEHQAKQGVSNDPRASTNSRLWLTPKNPRIIRASRLFGGKDRHSKVTTIRGLRDRRVRLSVPTAIQLYDLQEKLGLNQPSKVVDWLLNAAEQEIDKLPPLQMPQGDFIHLNKSMATPHEVDLPHNLPNPSTIEKIEYINNISHPLSCYSAMENGDILSNNAFSEDSDVFLRSKHEAAKEWRSAKSDIKVMRENDGDQVAANGSYHSSLTGFLNSAITYTSYCQFEPFSAYNPNFPSFQAEVTNNNHSTMMPSALPLMPGSHAALHPSGTMRSMPLIFSPYTGGSADLDAN